MLVFGIIDFGRMATDRIALTAAARAAAQAEATGGDPAAAANRAYPGGGLTVSNPVPCPANPTTDSAATATVQATFVFSTPIGIIPGIGTGTHFMRSTGAVPCRG
jgi:Flp pilus assembly protein TadG